MRVGLGLKLLIVFCYILWLPYVWRKIDILKWLIYHSGGDEFTGVDCDYDYLVGGKIGHEFKSC